MQKPTITQVKQSGVLGEYFFSRDTLRFFGQTMSSFKTDWQDKDNGIVRLYAPMFIGGDNVGTTERFLQVESNAITNEVTA